MNRLKKRISGNAISRLLFFLAFNPSPLFSMRVRCAPSAHHILRRGGAGAAVVLSKHQHMFDILALVMAIWRQIDFIAKAELFRHPIARWYLEWTSTIEIHRGTKEALSALYVAVDRLIKGMIVLFFAEGTRRPWNSIDEIEGGVLTMFKLLERAQPGVNIPIVAVGIHYGRKRLYFVPIWTVDVYIGPRLLLSDCGSEKEQIMDSLLTAMRNAQYEAVAQARARGCRSVYPDQAPCEELEQEAV